MSATNKPKRVSLTEDRLQSIIAAAVAAAVAGLTTVPTATAKPVEPEFATPKVRGASGPKGEEATERFAKYLQSKKDVALKLLREKGVHYNVFQKGRKLYIWSDITFDKARRTGHAGNLGNRIWSTAQVESLSGQPMPGAVSA